MSNHNNRAKKRYEKRKLKWAELVRERDMLKTDNARLRKALGHIANLCECQELCSCSSDMEDIAKAALAPDGFVNGMRPDGQ